MEKQRELILLDVFGQDRPGVTASLTDILASCGADILDIGQAVIHNTLSLGLLFAVPEEKESSPILKELLFRAYEMGVTVKFTPISEERYSQWVGEQGKDRYIITLLGRKISAAHVAGITKVLASQKMNIDIITRLSGRPSIKDDSLNKRACVELSVRGTPLDEVSMKRDFLRISKEIGIDVSFQKDNAFRKNKRLICFDMDSTLIQAEVIVELSRYAGVEEEVERITESAMRGEIDFNESFVQRVALLKGIDESVMQEIAVKLPITEGAERLLTNLRKFGYKTAILSGGFTYFGEHLKKMLGFDYVFANQLEIVGGKLTGKHLGEIVNGEKKAELMQMIAAKEGIQLAQVIAVGDGANDLPMINKAGLGIAFHAKPLVQESADNNISTLGLDGILYMLGFRDREID
jgi:phosphoserine phosphatase